MQGFQEQQLFTGAAQSQGFQPDQTPDTVSGLRAGFETKNRSFQNLITAKRQQHQADLNRAIQNTELLGQIVPAAKKYGEQMAKAYLDSEAIKAQDDAIKMGEMANFGITPQEQQDFQALSERASQETGAANDAAYSAYMQGAPTEAINYLKSLPRYRQLYASQYWTKTKMQEYPEYHSNFLLRNTQYTDPRNGSKFTASQVGGDPVRAGIVDAHAKRSFLGERVGISQTYNPSKVIMRPLYQGMAKQSLTYAGQVREVNNVQQSQAIKASANQAFAVNQRFSDLINANRGLRVFENNKYRTLNNSEAISQAYDDVVNLYKANAITRIEAESILKQEVEQAKGKQYGTFYQERSTKFIDDLNAVDSKRRTARKNEQSDLKDQLDTQLSNYIQNDWDGDPSKLKAAQSQLITIANNNGIFDYKASLADTHLSIRQDRQTQEFYAKSLADAQEDGTLSVDMLMNPKVPANLRQQYMPAAVEQDGIRAELPDEAAVKADLNTALKTALGDNSVEANYLGLRSATHAALRRYRKRVANLYPAVGAAEAHNTAFNEVQTLILNKQEEFGVADWKDRGPGDVTYSYWPKFGNPGMGMQGQSYEAAKYVEAFKKDNTIIDRAPMVPYSTLESVAAQIRAGGHVDIPGIYYQLGGSVTENLNRNLKAVGLADQMQPRPSDVVQEQSVDPGLRRLTSKARSVFDQQRIHAAHIGATSDARFMSPAALAQVTNTKGLRRSHTGALTYSTNETLYKSAGTEMQTLGFQIAEHPDFGGTKPVHSENSYHKYGEAFDITHQTGEYDASIKKTRLLKEAIRSLNPPLFLEIIGPGDGDPNHATHLHVGGLARPITPEDIKAIKKAMGGNK
jgi:hypothetical protein